LVLQPGPKSAKLTPTKCKRERALLEEGDEVRLGRLLESHDGRGLEAEVRLEVLSDLADEALEAGGARASDGIATTKQNK